MIEAIILGIIQGIAEFLPISSSAHLIIFRDIFGIGNSMGDSALAFDLALHLGTVLAIIVFFFKDLWNMFIKGITKGPKDKEGKMLWYIIVATIPAALIGVLFEEIIEDVIRGQFYLIASALILMGIIIYLADKSAKEKKDINDMTLKDAFLIGCSQMFALIPGFSRSGTTIATARILKLKREDAAKFSFFLSAPVVLGAAVWFVIKRGFDPILDNLSLFFTGTLVAFIIGMLCISFLLKYLRKNDFKLFMWYRVALGLFVIIYLILK
jgi:undecaprenyl-diphosphatase UppP